MQESVQAVGIESLAVWVTAVATVILAVATIVLGVYTAILARVANLQFRSTVDPRILIYPELQGDMITLVVENRGEGSAYGIKVMPAAETKNYYDAPILATSGWSNSVLGPGQRLVFIWYFWTSPEQQGEPVKLICSYRKHVSGRRLHREEFFVDPATFAGASIGLSKSPVWRVNELLERIARSSERLKPAER